jgi:hypothetical protein
MSKEKMEAQIDKLAAWHRSRKRGNPLGRGKAKAVKLVPVPTGWDEGAKGLANQTGLRIEPATDFDPSTGKESPNPNGVKRRRRDGWLTRYQKAGKLTVQQEAAGIKLRMASEGMRERDPLAALRIDRAAGQSDPEAARVDGRAYFRSLWAGVPKACRPVIERVVLDDRPIPDGNMAQRERYMQRLRDGLDAIP